MEITKRRQEILYAVVKLYTQTGEPVGSKLLSTYFDNAFSSATLRSEMAALERAGLLMQPHTSAGRVPTHLGYRYYIDQLLGIPQLSAAEEEQIRRALSFEGHDPAKLLEESGQVLASFTGFSAISTTPERGGATIKAIKFILLNRRIVVVTMVLSTADVKNRVCRLDFDVTEELLGRFSELINARMTDLAIEEVNSALVETLLRSLAEYALLLSPLVHSILDICHEVEEGDVYFGGEVPVANDPQQRKTLAHLLKDRGAGMTGLTINGVRVILGDELPLPALGETSLVTAQYRFGPGWTGSIGIVGPVRMDYARIIPHIEYFAKIIGNLLNEALDE